MKKTYVARLIAGVSLLLCWMVAQAVANMPSREELIAEIVGLIGSPAGNLVAAIGAPASDIAGILTTLEERQAA